MRNIAHYLNYCWIKWRSRPRGAGAAGLCPDGAGDILQNVWAGVTVEAYKLAPAGARREGACFFFAAGRLCRFKLAGRDAKHRGHDGYQTDPQFLD
ncbi:MAG: hypothetical protein WAO08_14370, partial [Hyphomicrobiaceae bacterium]